MTGKIDYKELSKQFIGGQYEFCFDYPEFYKYIASKQFTTMVELGNYYGWSCCFLCNERKIYNEDFIVYAIDLHDMPLVKESLGTGYAEVDFMRQRQYRIFETNVKNHNLQDKISVIKSCSWEAASLFEDNSLDFVFVDADHQYESVRKDIMAWYPKIRKGGIIAGHDYLSEFRVADAVKSIFGERYQVWEEGVCHVWYTTRE